MLHGEKAVPESDIFDTVFTSGKSLLYGSLTIYVRKVKDAFYNDQNISTTGSI